VTKTLQTLALVCTLALGWTALARAQKPEAPPAPRAAVTITPVKIQVVISRYQGEKKISSMPYNLSINSRPYNAPGAYVPSSASLRMGASVPVVMMAVTNVPKDAPQGGPIQYKDVGTNIDCDATVLEDGRFKVQITVDDASVYPEEQPTSPATKGSPSFRSFRATDAMIIKDGQTAQFTAATDKVNGETVKVDVTLTVVK
jgi:hypothetical protein